MGIEILIRKQYNTIDGKPFDSKMDAIMSEKDIQYDRMVKPNESTRKRVADTDIGTKLKQEIEDLKMLYTAYRDGIL